jgi:uncharacterized membrane protein
MNNWMNKAVSWGWAEKRSRTERVDLGPWLSVIGGVGLGAGLGAGLMYLLDPDRGRRRRALLRDGLAHTARILSDATGTTSRDLSHRAYGLWAEGSQVFKSGRASDEVLEARVRSRMGRVVSHPHAVNVDVEDGRVSLSGHVLADEARTLLSSVAKVRGVREVEDQLTVHAEAGDEPSLQGGRPRPGEPFEFMQVNWSPTARLLAGVAGSAMMGYCFKRRDAFGTALGTIGSGLLARGLTNLEMRSLVGVGRDGRAVVVQKTITINAPVGQVFDFWNDYGNFPRFMSNVREVTPSGNGRSHWKVAGPAGVPVEWTAEVTESVRNQLLAWRTVPGSAVRSEGEVRFEPTSTGTRVHIRLCYYPPVGAVGHALAKLFGADPKSEMDADLVRMKRLIETGQAPRDAANPAAGREAALIRPA